MPTFIPDQTPSEISLGVIDFCRSVQPAELAMFVPVCPDDESAEKDCFYSVAKRCERLGGNIVYGWNIWTWPSVWLKAEHHAVWRSPTGDLVDITPKANEVSEILFLPDASKPYDFDRNRRLPNIWKLFKRDQAIDALYAAEMNIFQYEEDSSVDGSLQMKVDPFVYNRLLAKKEFALAKLALKYVGANERCACRSGQKFKRCHRPVFEAVVQKVKNH